MKENNNVVSIETDHHVIELSEGCLTIGEKTFPDDCVSLACEEVEEVLILLLQCNQSSLDSGKTDTI